jgi:hypothetical protein
LFREAKERERPAAGEESHQGHDDARVGESLTLVGVSCRQTKDAHQRKVREERLERGKSRNLVDEVPVLQVHAIGILALAEKFARALDNAHLGLGVTVAAV